MVHKGSTPARDGLGSAVRAWLRKAAHVGYVFVPLPTRWKNRVAHVVYRITGWIFKGDRN